MDVKKLRNFLLGFLISLVPFGLSRGATITSNGSGAWNNPATWMGGVPPTISDVVIINAGDSVWITNSTNTIGNITINGILNIANLPAADFQTDGFINVNGKLYNNGSLDMVAVNNFTLGVNALYYHNPRNAAEVSIFVRGIENFDPTSTLIIMKWDDEGIPLGDATRVGTGNFGNVVLSFPSPLLWEQRGKFAPNRIKGSFTVTSGSISMDDGLGTPTTSLTLQNVTITGTGNVIFQSGVNRNLTLVTGSFTDNSTSALNTTMLFNSYGTLNWTVNGNLSISHNFVGIEGTLSEAASATLAVNGNFTIGGGSFEFLKQVNGNLTVNISGTTSISGTPSKVRFIDSNNGNFTLTTSNMDISGGTSNIFVGGSLVSPQYNGIPNITVSNDLTVSGTSTTTLIDADQSTRKIRLVVGRDFIFNAANANFTMANSVGPVTLSVARYMTMTGGNFTGQANNYGAQIDSLLITSDFTFNSATSTNYFRGNSGIGNTVFTVGGTFRMLNSGTNAGEGVYGIFIPAGAAYNQGVGSLTMTIGGQYIQNAGRVAGIHRGGGNLTFNCTAGMFDMNGGDFRGINNTDTTSAGIITMNLNSMDYDGGKFIAHNASHSGGLNGTVNITGVCKVNFTNASDQFMFVGLPLVAPLSNSMILNLTIGGNLNISGANGTFISSCATLGNENITINGSMNVSAGNNSFNYIRNSGQSVFHSVNLNIAGSLNVSGGTLILSAESGTLTATVSQDFVLSNGTVIAKGGLGSGTFNINGHYDQSGGVFSLYQNASVINTLIVMVNTNADGDNNGNFVHTGGTIEFSNNGNASSGENVINIRNPNVTFGGNGQINCASPGTGARWGWIYYMRAGTINYVHTSGVAHSISQVKQSIEAGCTVDVTSGYFQVASHTLNTESELIIKGSGILALRNNTQVAANGFFPESSIVMAHFSRLRTQHPNGFYNGTTNAALSSTSNMNFNLGSASAIEYNAAGKQIITGIGVGNATGIQHKYGILEVNNTGVANVDFAYPENNSVFVRFQLVLTSGELNLDDDHNPSNGGGRLITVEAGATTSITRTSGYIRSETEDGSSIVRWKMSAVGGSRIFPFGYNSTNYIPFKYTYASGTPDTVSVATYHTNVANLPYPPGVTHVHDQFGADNSVNTVDRFWYVNTTGTVASVDYEFVYVNMEDDLLSGNPRAQKWLTIPAWSFPFPGTQSNIVNGTIANGITNKSGWWTLASINNPLPVELLDFSANCSNGVVNVNWVTASERDNAYFTVERSRNGNDFTELGRVDGSGNTSQAVNYSFADSKPYEGRNYYRLVQTDFNGRSEKFKTISVYSCAPSDQLTLQVASGSETVVIINSPVNDSFTLRMTDVAGRTLLAKAALAVYKGVNAFELNTGAMSQGVYFITIESPNASATQRFFLGH